MSTGFSSSGQSMCVLAMSVSLALHALLIADLFHSPMQDGARVGRHAGMPAAGRRLSVFAVVSPLEITPVADLVSRPRNISRRPAVHPRHPPSSPPGGAAAVTTTAVGGSRFVSPFAPVLSSPLGRAGWGMPALPQMNPQQAQYLREQARAGYRAALMERLSTWVAQQAQRQQKVSCMIRVGLDSRQARIHCTPETFDGELWGALSGLAVAGTAGDGERACLRAGTAQLGFIRCEEEQDHSS